jgi:hypothetical protein
MHKLTIDDQIERDFSVAHMAALRNSVLSALRREPATLLPFEEVRSRFFIRGQYDRGLQTVPLANIVGSQGRYADFDRHFLPLSSHERRRWESVDRAYYRDINLPAVDLYKLGEIYFVADGNHRVSVARRRGQIDIDARVVELQVDVPLTPDLDLRDLIRKGEQSDFFEWTNLAQFRPGCGIEVSELGGYLDLIRHINRRRAFLKAERGAEVSAEEAIVDWYDTVYQPVVAAIRRSRVLRSFRGRTETDLYIWMMANREELLGQTEEPVASDEEMAAFMQRYGSLRARLQRRWLGRFG